MMRMISMISELWKVVVVAVVAKRGIAFECVRA
jgi:hypothetical protein